MSPDPAKTSAAIAEMERPQSITELRRFMGMVIQLGKFTPNLAKLAQPLRVLLSVNKEWIRGGPHQEESFHQIKAEFAYSQLCLLPEASLKISSDASAYGLGAVLLQSSADNTLKPVAYASRFMSDTEQRYSQIEKEALGIVWACEKFKDYVLGKHICIETDHKPLVPLFSKTDLANLLPCILHFRLK